MDEATALQIVKDARGAFPKKTNNKIYDFAPLDDGPTDKGALGDVIFHQRVEMEDVVGEMRERLKKAIARNEAVDAYGHLRSKNPERGTPNERGRAMFARKDADAIGNCREQSAVAAHLAVRRRANEETEKVFVAVIEPPGDHGFCVVGPRTPTWKTVADMKADAQATSYRIIDPWMNFTCLADVYAERAKAKCVRWLGRAKRIAWDGKGGQTPGYYPPGDDYQEAFATGPLRYEEADPDIA